MSTSVNPNDGDEHESTIRYLKTWALQGAGKPRERHGGRKGDKPTIAEVKDEAELENLELPGDWDFQNGKPL